MFFIKLCKQCAAESYSTESGDENKSTNSRHDFTDGSVQKDLPHLCTIMHVGHVAKCMLMSIASYMNPSIQ